MKRRDGNPANPHNWRLVCSVCAAEWPASDKIDLVGGHFQKEHPDLPNPAFTTVWAGIGPQPRGAKMPGRPRGGRRRR
jgi:hypothetical protein